MKSFFRRLGFSGSGQQTPTSFPCSFPASEKATESILDTPADAVGSGSALLIADGSFLLIADGSKLLIAASTFVNSLDFSDADNSMYIGQVT
ncbi:MAG: hypothetical protein MJE12_09060 [Alphaproteobacteria bacterium]|nr:hypothetical protein [Alphaproteobacteria bacterium]